MKVLSNIVDEKDINVKYPFGANVQNETDTIDGTPIVRGVYSEVLMNMYRIMELTNVVPNNIEDDKTTQFQLVEALKKLPNSLNDIEQVLTLSGSVWSVPFDLSILPNKYFFFARAKDGYVNATTFRGTGVLELPFSSSGFNASDELLVIIDSLTVRAYSLTKLSDKPDFINTIANSVVRYSKASDLYYLDSGKLFKNLQVWDLQNAIRVDQSDGTLILQSAFMMQGHFVCIVKNPTKVSYEFYAFDLLDLNTVIGLTTDIVQTPSTDYSPEFFAKNQNIYVSNKCNRSVNDYEFTELVFDTNFYTLNESTSLSFDVSFVKTNNGAIVGDDLYTLVSNTIDKFDVNTGVKISVGIFPSVTGHLFTFNDTLYVNQNNIASKLNI